mgnify:CR=1 FL=1|jgi:hypothetical protein
MINLANQLYAAWNTCDIEQVKPLLSSDVTYKDWNVNETGFDNVTAGIKHIMDSFPNLQTDVTGMTTDSSNSKVTVEMSTYLYSGRTINITNVLTCNETHITSIEAVIKE